MKRHVLVSNFTPVMSLTSRLPHATILRAVLAGLVFVQTHSALGALSFTRGIVTSAGPEQFASTVDSDILVGGFTAPGVLSSGLYIPETRIQYDTIDNDPTFTYSLSSWTLYYSSALAPDIIGAATPLGYVDPAGNPVPQGGGAYTTLFNAGYGIYTYNTGAPWSIDYEADHITFTAVAGGVPPGGGAGDVTPGMYLPSFDIEFSPNLGVGSVAALALFSAPNGAGYANGTVLGPVLVPEPSTSVLGLIGASVMIWRRLRR